MITMFPVESTMIKAIGHDPINNILVVKFVRGQVYSYEGVSAKLFQELKWAESVGKFFHEKIEKNFKTIKMEV